MANYLTNIYDKANENIFTIQLHLFLRTVQRDKRLMGVFILFKKLSEPVSFGVTSLRLGLLRTSPLIDLSTNKAVYDRV